MTVRRSPFAGSASFAFAWMCITVATLAAQAPVPASAPANSWPQFRGSASLSGNTAATVPATLKLLWTYDAGDAIESSAAIADDVVYVGSRTGELVAIGLADGSVKWKYKTSPDGIGESSPAVAGGLVYVGDLSGVLHAVDAASGKAAWTFKTNGELKSSPVVAGDRVLIGSYDTHLYAVGARDGKLLWKFQTDGYVHATPAVVNGVAYVTGCDEVLHGIRITDGKEVLNVASGAYTGASPAIAEGRAYYGTYDNEVLSVDLKSRKVLWRYKRADRNFPFYSSAALSGLSLIHI